MTNMLNKMAGKKTYTTGFVILALIVCSWQGWIKIPNEAYLILFTLMIAFLKAGVNREIKSMGFKSATLEATAEAIKPRSAIRAEQRTPEQSGGTCYGLLALISGAVILTASLAFLIGCATNQRITPVPQADGSTVLQTNMVRTLDTNTVIKAIRGVVPPAVSLACAKDTNARAYFVQAKILLTAAADSGEVDPAAIKESLSTISVRELRTQEAIVAEQAALALYDAFASQVVDQQLDKVAWLRPVLAEMAAAINEGLK